MDLGGVDSTLHYSGVVEYNFRHQRICMLHIGGKPLGAFARWVASRGQTPNRPLLELSLQARCCRGCCCRG